MHGKHTLLTKVLDAGLEIFYYKGNLRSVVGRDKAVVDPCLGLGGAMVLQAAIEHLGKRRRSLANGRDAKREWLRAALSNEEHFSDGRTGVRAGLAIRGRKNNHQFQEAGQQQRLLLAMAAACAKQACLRQSMLPSPGEWCGRWSRGVEGTRRRRRRSYVSRKRLRPQRIQQISFLGCQPTAALLSSIGMHGFMYWTDRHSRAFLHRLQREATGLCEYRKLRQCSTLF